MAHPAVGSTAQCHPAAGDACCKCLCMASQYKWCSCSSCNQCTWPWRSGDTDSYRCDCDPGWTTSAGQDLAAFVYCNAPAPSPPPPGVASTAGAAGAHSKCGKHPSRQIHRRAMSVVHAGFAVMTPWQYSMTWQCSGATRLCDMVRSCRRKHGQHPLRHRPVLRRGNAHGGGLGAHLRGGAAGAGAADLVPVLAARQDRLLLRPHAVAAHPCGGVCSWQTTATCCT